MRLNEEEERLILERIEDTYKGESLLSISILHIKFSSKPGEEKLSFLDAIDEKLSKSKEYLRYNLYIELAKLQVQLDDENLDQNVGTTRVENLFQKALNTRDPRLIKDWIKFRMNVTMKNPKTKGEEDSEEYSHRPSSWRKDKGHK